MDEISVKIDNEIDINKIDVDKIGKPHNGKPITKIEVSPKEKYLVTYSHEDDSIAGWNIEDKDECQLNLDSKDDDPWNNEDKDEGQLKLDVTFKLSDINNNMKHICVSDDKKLAYIVNNNELGKLL